MCTSRQSGGSSSSSNSNEGSGPPPPTASDQPSAPPPPPPHHSSQGPSMAAPGGSETPPPLYPSLAEFLNSFSAYPDQQGHQQQQQPVTGTQLQAFLHQTLDRLFGAAPPPRGQAPPPTDQASPPTDQAPPPMDQTPPSTDQTPTPPPAGNNGPTPPPTAPPSPPPEAVTNAGHARYHDYGYGSWSAQGPAGYAGGWQRWDHGPSQRPRPHQRYPAQYQGLVNLFLAQADWAMQNIMRMGALFMGLFLAMIPLCLVPNTLLAVGLLVAVAASLGWPWKPVLAGQVIFLILLQLDPLLLKILVLFAVIRTYFLGRPLVNREYWCGMRFCGRSRRE